VSSISTKQIILISIGEQDFSRPLGMYWLPTV